MNLRSSLPAFVLGAACFAALGPTPFPAQDPEVTTESQYLDLAKPGPEHERLAALVGEWDTEVLVKMMPGAKPLRTKGTAKSESVLGGRYVAVKTAGHFMGTPHETLSFFGFDRRYKTFTSVNLDNAGTYWVTAKSEGEAGEGEIVMAGSEHDPVFGVDQKYRQILKIADENRFSVAWEMEFPGQDPYVMLETRFTRRGTGD